MTYLVDFREVSTGGLESSPVAHALAGLRANEARYITNRFAHAFAVEPAEGLPGVIDRVNRILAERDLVIASRPLEATEFEAGGIRFSYVFYESGLALNVMYTLAHGGKRAVGFKLAQGMEVPAELAAKFKFARQRSKLAGEIRGSFFVIKGEY
ncbi:phage tail protein [Agromyces sp. M3QZ16-3]|uniref:phage tail protein n=1 Tax=Agromyces sp. M3QZ16-3 TaxID=3447585 RepID=UPI003F694843